jgi:hypothetical protein
MIRSIEKFSDLIWNRTLDLPACSIRKIRVYGFIKLITGRKESVPRFVASRK